MLPCCFPNISPSDISAMEYQLLKYRGLTDTSNMLSSKFLYFCSKFQKDITDKAIDPYPRKVMMSEGK
jgi:hypothetical protein